MRSFFEELLPFPSLSPVLWVSLSYLMSGFVVEMHVNVPIVYHTHNIYIPFVVYALMHSQKCYFMCQLLTRKIE